MFEKLKTYLAYLLKAKSAHGIHSPFVYDFYNEVLHDNRYFTVFDDIEILREEMQHDQRLIEVVDYGAGASNESKDGFAKKIKSVAEIATRTAITKREGELLFRMVDKYNPANILELGTSVGISSLYLAMQNSHCKIVTLEGSINISEIAKENFKLLAVENIEVFVGQFDETLPLCLEKIIGAGNNKVGMVFIDGNHRYEPTMKYFQVLLTAMGDDSFIVFHDINWSVEMQMAWKEISNHPKVSVSIDIYTMGIVFLKPGIPKQHFVLSW